MERLTKLTDGVFCVEDTQAAIDRLAVFENIYHDLAERQDELSAELAELREQDKTKSARFRERMGQKLMNSHVITVFQTYGLK